MNGFAENMSRFSVGLATAKHREMVGLTSQIGQMESGLDELQRQAQKVLQIRIAGLKREAIRMYEGD